MRLQRSDLAAVDSPSMYDHVYDVLRCIGSFLFIENSQHSAELILSNNLHSIRPAKTNDVPNHTEKHDTTGISNDLVPRTARYPEKAREVDPRRERDNGRQPPSKARPTGSNRPMAARIARESGERDSTSKAEISNLGEKNLKSSVSQ